MGENEVPRGELDLNDDPEVISPPIVDSPLYACATAAIVLGFIPHADLELEIDGATLPPRPGGFPDPDGFTFTGLTPLVADQVIRARQIWNGVTSGWSNSVTVRKHTEDFPAGPPRPEINPAPVYECGSRTGVSNLLTGCNVWITADGSEVGRVEGAKKHQGVNVNPDYGLNQHVRAHAELCDDPSPPSEEHITQHPPTPLATPALDDAFESGEQIRITNLVNGARFTIDRGGMSIGPIRTWGYAHLVDLSPPFAAGETISVTQRMCPSDPSSAPGSTTIRPCAELPAPEVAPIQVGDTVIRLTAWVVGAQIKVFAGFTKIGDAGGGPLIALTRSIQDNETIYVYQVVGSCQGSTVRVVEPRCVAPPLGSNPAWLNLFPVGHLDYADGDVKGSVFYPAEDDGKAQPFNTRWAGLGRSPIVFMAHGNHHTHYDPADREHEGSPSCGGVPPGWNEIPNHKGYDYLQHQLARMGFVAVSVDCNETNGCTPNSIANIERRADLIMASIDHFQSLDTGGDAIFGDRLDFQQVGLMGHSRGGEAVVVAGNQAPGALGVDIKAVISLAPVNHEVFTPDVYAFMTILPASDGDVSDNGGAIFYDTAPQPFKSQLYIDFADHNYFNRQWVTDEDGRVPPAILERGEHERILSAYGCALFRAFLMGHATTGFLTDRSLPPGIDTDNVHLSFEWRDQVTVDDHEQANGIGQNTLGGPIAQSGGMSADEFELWQFAANGHPSDSFYGHSTGMVIEGPMAAVFRSELDRSYDLNPSEVWIRVAEVSEGGANPSDGTGFEIGLEDQNSLLAWTSSDETGGVPRPFDQAPGSTKTMLTTLRFPASCFVPENVEFDPSAITAILLRQDRASEARLAFDVLQLVQEP